MAEAYAHLAAITGLPLGEVERHLGRVSAELFAKRLELDQNIFPNLELRVYAGGHMFYTHASAREQMYRDVEAMYRPAVTSQPH